MKATHLVLRPDQHQPALNVLGTQVTVLAANAATQSHGVTLQQGDEGTGPPPHSHDWDECFYVLKGGVEFLCDGKAHTCSAGTLVHVPRGTPHGFHFGPGGGQMLELTGQGALAAHVHRDRRGDAARSARCSETLGSAGSKRCDGGSVKRNPGSKRNGCHVHELLFRPTRIT